ncbi:MAG: hypothetical protein ACQKBV_03590 [Puniceicoccales bacterium]
MTVLANARILTMDGQMAEFECGWIALDGDRLRRGGGLEKSVGSHNP